MNGKNMNGKMPFLGIAAAACPYAEGGLKETASIPATARRGFKHYSRKRHLAISATTM